MIDSMVSRLAVSAALGNGLLARSAADTDAVDHKPLLSAVSLEEVEEIKKIFNSEEKDFYLSG